jgi:hypothetical protein
MWIFTTIGFFSVVQKHGEDFLTVRARAASDLDRLRTQYLSDLSPTIVTKSADYHYRATISHGSFSRGMAAMCQRYASINTCKISPGSWTILGLAVDCR